MAVKTFDKTVLGKVDKAKVITLYEKTFDHSSPFCL